MSHTPIFAIWNSMKQRCLNPNNHAYARYGGRGVTVCERWQVFENFYADMGERPEGMSLERVDNDKGYEPGNVVWATAKQQNRNRRSSAIIDFDGVLATIAEWSEITGIKPATLSQRIRLGWDAKRALTEPAIRRGQHA